MLFTKEKNRCRNFHDVVLPIKETIKNLPIVWHCMHIEVKEKLDR